MAQTGRPRKIDEPVIVNGPDGQRTTTRGDYFLERLAQGASIENAADQAGIGRSTAKQALARGEDRDPHRDGDEAFAAFAARARERQAEGQAIFERTITLASVPRPVTTRKTGWREVLAPDGQVRRLEINETTVREEYDWRAAAWKLTNGYGVRPPADRLELSGPDGEPLRAERLAAEALAYILGRADQAADGDVIEVRAIESEHD